MQLVYCDTCVYRDYYEWRPGRNWLHFGEEAKRLFDQIEEGHYKIIVSDHLAFQLNGFKQFDEFVDKMKEKGQIVEIKKTKEDKRKANEHMKNHPDSEFEDALHAELAIRAGADFFATRNIEHFSSYGNKLKICFPEHVGLM